MWHSMLCFGWESSDWSKTFYWKRYLHLRGLLQPDSHEGHQKKLQAWLWHRVTPTFTGECSNKAFLSCNTKTSRFLSSCTNLGLKAASPQSEGVQVFCSSLCCPELPAQATSWVPDTGVPSTYWRHSPSQKASNSSFTNVLFTDLLLQSLAMSAVDKFPLLASVCSEYI